MADRSSWLRFLPPILWEHEPPAPAFSLGSSLRIFEKILTGIDDGIVIGHDAHTHEALLAVIARLHRLYDPWHTPPEYLRWLAGWLALEFPEVWDEYQRRKVTSEIVTVYQQRGLKRGIEDFLDLYAVAATRPRVTVDDSSKLLITKPALDRIPDIASLNAQVPIVHPTAIARGPDGSLFMTDAGHTDLDDEEVWRFYPEGHYQIAGTPAIPTPLAAGDPSFNLVVPIGLATDTQAPYNVYVLERRGSSASSTPVLWRLTSPDFPTGTLVVNKGHMGFPIDPVAVARDPATDHLLVLSRPVGGTLRIFDVDVSVNPPNVVATVLSSVMTPLSLTVLSNGNLVIGDHRDDTTATPGDLVLVDRSTGPWTETSILGALPPSDNPIVAPTAIVEEAPGRLLVADVGLKPFDPSLADPYMKKIANHAAIYRVEIVPASVKLAGEPKQLVWPSGLALSPDGTLYISDRGEATAPGSLLDREWRATHQEFGVAVYIHDSPTTTPQQRRRLVHDVRQIINKEKPAHTSWTFMFRV